MVHFGNSPIMFLHKICVFIHDINQGKKIIVDGNSKDLTNRAIKAILQNWFKAPWKFKCVFYYVSLSYFKERRKENKIGSFKSEGWRIRNEICARLPFYRFLYTYLMRVYFTFLVFPGFCTCVRFCVHRNWKERRKLQWWKKILRQNDKTYWSGNKGENNRQILSRFFDKFEYGCLWYWYFMKLK